MCDFKFYALVGVGDQYNVLIVDIGDNLFCITGKCGFSAYIVFCSQFILWFANHSKVAFYISFIVSMDCIFSKALDNAAAMLVLKNAFSAVT